MSDERELSKWGNSIGVRIPNRIFQKTQLHEGDIVRVTVVDDETIKLEQTTTAGDGDGRVVPAARTC